jgi:hypothetical protein
MCISHQQLVSCFLFSILSSSTSNPLLLLSRELPYFSRISKLGVVRPFSENNVIILLFYISVTADSYSFLLPPLEKLIIY